jgi:hypothetical protein
MPPGGRARPQAVIGGRGGSRFDLDGDDATATKVDDEVDLLAAGLGSQVV